MWNLRHARSILGTKPTRDGYRAKFWRVRQMLKGFPWRNLAFFVIALLIVSYLMLLGVVIAIDRLLYVNWDTETPDVQPVKFERPTT
jgi:hypothetical protein